MNYKNLPKGVPVSEKPVIIVWRQPVVAGATLATGTYILPFDRIKHLLSHKPLRRPYRGEPRDEKQD